MEYDTQARFAWQIRYVSTCTLRTHGFWMRINNDDSSLTKDFEYAVNSTKARIAT